MDTRQLQRDPQYAPYRPGNTRPHYQQFPASFPSQQPENRQKTHPKSVSVDALQRGQTVGCSPSNHRHQSHTAPHCRLCLRNSRTHRGSSAHHQLRTFQAPYHPPTSMPDKRLHWLANPRVAGHLRMQHQKAPSLDRLQVAPLRPHTRSHRNSVSLDSLQHIYSFDPNLEPRVPGGSHNSRKQSIQYDLPGASFRPPWPSRDLDHRH